MNAPYLTGAELDHAVGAAEGLDVVVRNGVCKVMKRVGCRRPGCAVVHKRGENYSPSTDGSVSGLDIMERYAIRCELDAPTIVWHARITCARTGSQYCQADKSKHVAAMRVLLMYLSS